MLKGGTQCLTCSKKQGKQQHLNAAALNELNKQVVEDDSISQLGRKRTYQEMTEQHSDAGHVDPCNDFGDLADDGGSVSGFLPPSPTPKRQKVMPQLQQSGAHSDLEMIDTAAVEEQPQKSYAGSVSVSVSVPGSGSSFLPPPTVVAFTD